MQLSAPVTEKVRIWEAITKYIACIQLIMLLSSRNRVLTSNILIYEMARTPLSLSRSITYSSLYCFKLCCLQEAGEGGNHMFEFGVCAMQGWRTDMVRNPALSN